MNNSNFLETGNDNEFDGKRMKKRGPGGARLSSGGLNDSYAMAVKAVSFAYVAGTIDTICVERFKRLLFRACKAKVLSHFLEAKFDFIFIFEPASLPVLSLSTLCLDIADDSFLPFYDWLTSIIPAMALLELVWLMEGNNGSCLFGGSYF